MWIRNHARETYGVEIEPQAAAALAAVIDTDLRAADNEIAKLATYVDGARPITLDDLKLLTAYTAEADVFEMVDAIGRRDGDTALRLCHRRRQDSPAAPVGIMCAFSPPVPAARARTGGAPGD